VTGVFGNHDQYALFPYTPREGAASDPSALVRRQLSYFREGRLKLTFLDAASFRDFNVVNHASAHRKR